MAEATLAVGLACGRGGCPCGKAAQNGVGNTHCPSHEDEHPSLSIAEKGGMLLVNCRAGCSQDAVIQALRERSLWPEPKRNGDSPKRRSKRKQTRYEVRDSDGDLVAVHVREDRPEGKRMWWERPDGSTGLGGRPTSSLPLCGSEQLADLPDGAQIVVTEGEKETAALRSMGVNAVGTVTGADGTPAEEALRPLVRLQVALWPDADSVGVAHMQRVASWLTSLGCRVVRVVIWPEAPSKGDAADAVAHGLDVHRLIADAAAWKPGDVDLAGLLDDVVTFIRTYVVLTVHQLRALALWTVHTYALDAADCTPYLHVKSAEKRSGKTLLLEVLALLAARPWKTDRVTAAVLVRKVARDRPTLLLDESDAAFKGEKEYAEALRGILNSGYRRGGVVSLCVKAGGDFELRDFPVFGAKAIAGIGKLPDTVQDRSIPMEMRRKARNEHVMRFRLRDAEEEALPFKEHLENWAAMAVPALERAMADIPQELDDRAADVWEPLLAIADMAAGDWPQRAREAALALSVGSAREDDSLGVKLLRDIRNVFEGRKADRLSSEALVEALVKLEEAPWGDLWGKPLDPRRLAKILKPFGIGPKQLRIDPKTTIKGYYAADFEDSWDRYIPPERETSETGKQTESGQSGEGVQDVSGNIYVTETFPARETNSEPYKADVSDVSHVSVPRGVRAAVDASESQEWEEGEI